MFGFLLDWTENVEAKLHDRVLFGIVMSRVEVGQGCQLPFQIFSISEERESWAR